MLYYLFEYLDTIGVPGAGVIHFVSFRTSMTIITSLLFSTIFGKQFIFILQKQQIGETIRQLGLQGQEQKKGTPTMGGLIIISSILIPVLLWGKLNNTYLILMLVSTVWLGAIGFLDDYIKVVKKNKEGLAGKFKIVGQIGIGLIVGLTLYINSDVVIRENVPVKDQSGQIISYENHNIKSTQTNIPFVKNNNLDYADLIRFVGESAQKWAWFLFILITIFIVTAVSNGANMTDGLDGLATGTSAIIGVTLGILAYVSGHVEFAEYLNIIYIPNSQELVVYMGAFIGATIGFLWYNSYPAQVFMGDTGSLTLGGIIAVFAIIIRKELLIPILCGVFFIENLSVMLQVGWFKHTKKKHGVGRRIFLMAPLHHHFQKKGYHEAKIVNRFWIIGIILAVVTIVTLKVR